MAATIKTNLKKFYNYKNSKRNIKNFMISLNTLKAKRRMGGNSWTDIKYLGDFFVSTFTPVDIDENADFDLQNLTRKPLGTFLLLQMSFRKLERYQRYWKLPKYRPYTKMIQMWSQELSAYKLNICFIEGVRKDNQKPSYSLQNVEL